MHEFLVEIPQISPSMCVCVLSPKKNMVEFFMIKLILPEIPQQKKQSDLVTYHQF